MPVIVVLVAVGIATVTDLRMFKIHNVLTLPLLATGLVYHAVVGGADELLSSLLGALFGFGVLLLLYLAGGMGGGDIKLTAGVGAWLGVPLIFAVFLAASFAAGIYAVVLILVHGRLRETWVNLQLLGYRIWAVGRQLGGDDRIEDQVQRADRRGRLIPFGAMMGVGLVALLALARLRVAH
ncbi:MAG TPA: A24 family peptidase [Fimbriiglobus sp.]|nr:A24 family peptidase [Fimbriiglobus sp.]